MKTGYDRGILAAVQRQHYQSAHRDLSSEEPGLKTKRS
jgi:hypothetical protein